MTNRRRNRSVGRCLKAAVAAVALSLAVPMASSRDAAPVAGEASAQYLRPLRIELGYMTVCVGHFCYVGDCCEPGEMPF